MKKSLLVSFLIAFLPFLYIAEAKDLSSEDYYELIRDSFKKEFPYLEEVEFANLKGINTVDFSKNGKYLLITDGDKLILLDASSLKMIKSLYVKDNDGQSISSYWSATNFIISPEQKHILILDKYIDIESGDVISKLKINDAITKGNPNPEPLAISQNGKKALVLVHSFYDTRYDSLALFDLITGQLIHVIKNAETITNAVFHSDQTIIVFYNNGKIAIENLKDEEIYVLTNDGPVINVKAKNLSVVYTADNKYLLVSGATRDINNKICVFDKNTNKIIFDDNCEGNITISSDDLYVIYQSMRPSDKLCPCGRHKLIDLFLKIKNTKTGELKAEIKTPETFDIILLNSAENILYGIRHNKILKIDFDIEKSLNLTK